MKNYLKCALEELAVVFWAVVTSGYKAEDWTVVPIYFVPEDQHSVPVDQKRHGEVELATIDGSHFLRFSQVACPILFEPVPICQWMDPGWKSQRLYDSAFEPVWVIHQLEETQDEAERWRDSILKRREERLNWWAYLDQPENGL